MLRKPLSGKETRMFVYRLTEPIDDFDDLTPLPDWMHAASPHATRWMLQAILALADAAPVVGWRGDMRHLPAVGVTPASEATPYLVVKQDNNGDTFVVTAMDAPWAAAGTAACCRVTPRDVGAWIHPTREDIQSQMEEISAREGPSLKRCNSKQRRHRDEQREDCFTGHCGRRRCAGGTG
jgi:hypothetical protein